MKRLTTNFPLLLLVAWMAMAVMTVNSFIGFREVTWSWSRAHKK